MLNEKNSNNGIPLNKSILAILIFIYLLYCTFWLFDINKECSAFFIKFMLPISTGICGALVMFKIFHGKYQVIWKIPSILLFINISIYIFTTQSRSDHSIQISTISALIFYIILMMSLMHVSLPKAEEAKIKIIDPRNIPNNMANNEHNPDDCIRQNWAKNQLIIIPNTKYLNVTIAVLVRKILEKFPSEKILMCQTEYNHHYAIKKCISSEGNQDAIYDCFPYSKDKILSIFYCFNKYSDWDDWLFGVYRKENESHIVSGLEENPRLIYDDDFMNKYLEYSIFIQMEYDNIFCSVNKEELFDDFIDFSNSMIIQ